MPRAKPANSPSLSDNLDELLENLDPQKTMSKTAKKDVDAAKRVRDTFLGYRKQLTTVLDILQKNNDKSSDTLSLLADEAKGMILVLDQLEKRKRITADTLLNFVTQLDRMSSEVHRLKEEKNAAGEELKKKQERILGTPAQIAAQMKALSAHIGQNVGDYIKENPEKIGRAGGLGVKHVLAAILGPGAPIVEVLDQLVNFDKRVGQLIGLGGRLAKGVAGKTWRGTKKVTGAVAGAVHNATTKPLIEFTANQYMGLMSKTFKMLGMAKTPREKAQERREKAIFALNFLKMRRTMDALLRSSRAGFSNLLTGAASLIGGLFSKLAGLFTPLAALAGSLAGLTLGSVVGGIAAVLKPALLAAIPAWIAKLSGDMIEKNKDKGFYEGGINDSRATGYASAGLAGLGGGFLLGGLPGAAIGGLAGLGYAAYKDDLPGRAKTKVSTRLNYEENKKHLIEAARLTGIDPGLLGIKGKIESNFDANARNPNSSAEGLFQFTDKTWANTLAKYGSKYGFGPNTPKSDPRANAIMAAELLKESKASLEAAGTKFDASSSYMAHFLGAPAAGRFFNNMKNRPNSPAALDMPEAASSNKSIFYTNTANGQLTADSMPRSYSDVYGLIQRKVGQAASYGELARADAKAEGWQPGETTYTPRRRGSLSGAPYGAGDARQMSAPAVETPKSSINTVPFMPDDNSLLTVNLAGLLG